ncbi:small integral membrane protein 14 [Musca vetustissima]|uniref:small integral membrane protein 14 n=1 Tax=Musca vetustissima TaxID=27455 RepID=UPI002AB7309B|nr:small integral membrane protein 14 [Musca vetustissima]
MGDEYDGCECVWSHEWAMQRLLNFIRQNQNECTDTNCIDVTGRLQQPGGSSTGGEEGNFTMMTMIMIFAMVMYFIRPESILKLTNSNKRNGGNPNGNNGGGGPPPPTPPAVN